MPTKRERLARLAHLKAYLESGAGAAVKEAVGEAVDQEVEDVAALDEDDIDGPYVEGLTDGRYVAITYFVVDPEDQAVFDEAGGVDHKAANDLRELITFLEAHVIVDDPYGERAEVLDLDRAPAAEVPWDIERRVVFKGH